MTFSFVFIIANIMPMASRNFWHRLVGLRSTGSFTATAATHQQLSSHESLGPNASKRLQGELVSHHENAAKLIAQNRLVFFGEIHSMPPIVDFQRKVQAAMKESIPDQTGKLHVILEHFSFEQQQLLDDYLADKDMTFEQLQKSYHKNGEEGHELEPYREFLYDARSLGVRLHAGFIPRRFARKLLKDGLRAVVEETGDWMPRNPDLEGREGHYNVFESLISGRNMYSGSDPSGQFRRIFTAQLLKDAAMAHKVNKIIAQSRDNLRLSSSNDKFLIIAGNGHMLHSFGVPERVLEEHPKLKSESCLVISENTTKDQSGEEEENIANRLRSLIAGRSPADYFFLYENPTTDGELDWNEAKLETQKAYDKVGETAAIPGNVLKAAWIMHNLGYSEEQFMQAGGDSYNFQGVGNPHQHANIKPGEAVLDVGSGLGVDTFIASYAVGPTGSVVGIDLSEKEVKHSSDRARERKMNNVEFVIADMENIPMANNSIDVIISNGAFCLAANKEKAFQELFRVLKPGGRISVCTTTTRVDDLEPGVNWPLCMKMFINKDELHPLCQRVGFENVVIDDTDSSMTMEIPEAIQNEAQHSGRSKIHAGSREFDHLEGYDMDKLCARVCVRAQKPS